MKQTTELELFVASPGDLREERDLVRRVADRVVAMCGVELGTRIRVTGWERVAPDLGRPQDLINPLVDSCDIFVGLLHRRWGSDTGSETSGFLEEFERVVARRGAGDEPAVALFFRSISSADEADPGLQLGQVLDFRKRVRTDHVALYREFDGVDDLDRQLVEYLVGLIARRASLLRSDANPAQSPEAPAPGPLPDAVDTYSVDTTNDAQRQVAKVLDGYGAAIRGEETVADLDFDRMLLFSLSIADGPAIPTHVVNRLYSRRAELALLLAEGEHWLKTLALDFATGDLASLVVPGWYLVAGTEVADRLASIAVSDDDSASRGALQMLTAQKSRPATFWPSAEGVDEQGMSTLAFTWNGPLANAGRASGAMGYLATVAETGDATLVDAIAQVQGGDIPGEELAALLASLTGDFEAIVTLATANRYREPDWVREIILRSLDQISNQDLARLVEAKRGVSTTIREKALSRLINLDSVDDGTLIVSLIDDSSCLRDRAMRFVESHPQRARALLAALAEEKAYLAVLVRPKLMALAMSPDELRANAPSLLSDNWEAMLWSGGEAKAGEARATLTQTADEWRAFASSQLPALSDESDLLSYLRGRRIRAAALLLARLPPASRADGDPELIRAAAQQADLLSKFEIAVAMAPMAEPADVPILLETARIRRDEPCDDLLNVALELAELGKVRELVSSKDPVHSEAALRFLIREGHATTDELRQLLLHEQPKQRVIAAQALVDRMDRSEVEQLLNEYVSAGRHFYNVVATFDRSLFAPAGLRVLRI